MVVALVKVTRAVGEGMGGKLEITVTVQDGCCQKDSEKRISPGLEEKRKDCRIKI